MVGCRLIPEAKIERAKSCVRLFVCMLDFFIVPLNTIWGRINVTNLQQKAVYINR